MAKITNTTTDDKEQVLITKSGLEKLKIELKELKTIGRKEVSERLAEAISYGDLSENSEYDEAKNQQAFIEGRILELESQVKNAKIIEESVDKGIVQIGSTVGLKRLDEKEKHEYTIVGSTEADPIMRKISNESPVGAAILGKKKKDKVKIIAPGGTFTYEILEVK
ncbi:transcription elongation factor GreA [Candidatus Gracilibacteria bacterium]|nr:transcription elongation factor GreA [Candidatus Gracilibacteria bacterium]